MKERKKLYSEGAMCEKYRLGDRMSQMKKSNLFLADKDTCVLGVVLMEKLENLGHFLDNVAFSGPSCEQYFSELMI